MKQVYLYFGSFNPPHTGHLAIAHYLINSGKADELWFVVSPHNPLKEPHILSAVEHRLRMTQLAVDALGLGEKVKVCDRELSMPSPSYSYDTLGVLSVEHPQVEFVVVIGEDNYACFDKWYRWQDILRDYRVAVYPRNGTVFCEPISSDSFEQLIGVPTFNISSTDIRAYIQKGIDVSLFTTKEVASYIHKNELYVRK